MVAGLRATHAVADFLMEVKKVSSRWVHEQLGLQQFRWQEGYGPFTVSDGDVAGIRRYVATQQEHHRRRSFQEEYRALLVEHGVAFDERYRW